MRRPGGAVSRNDRAREHERRTTSGYGSDRTATTTAATGRAAKRGAGGESGPSANGRCRIACSEPGAGSQLAEIGRASCRERV